MYLHVPCRYVTAEKVTSGYLYTEVNFNNLPPIRETYDLCYILSSATEIECPLQAGKLCVLAQGVCISIIIITLFVEDIHYEMSYAPRGCHSSKLNIT